MEDGKVMAAPTFISENASQTQGTGAGVAAWPVGHQADDIGILVVQSANQTVATPSGWTLLGNVGVGTAGAVGATAAWVFWKRATTAAEADASIADPGDHFRARMYLFRGCETSGTPVHGTPVTATVSAPGTAVSIAMPTTTVNECYLVALVANATDSGSNQTAIGTQTWANAALSGFTRIMTGNTANGVGGGADAGGGVKTTAGAIGDSTATLATASAQAKMAFALMPPQGAPPPPPVTEGGIYVATGVKAVAGSTGNTTATMDTTSAQGLLTFALKTATPPANLPPVVDAVPFIQGAVNLPVVFPIVASDPEGVALTYTLVDGSTPAPAGAEFLQDEGSNLYSFSWVPTTDQAGEWAFSIRVSDGVNNVDIPVAITVIGLPDTTILTLAQALADRMAVDLQSAQAVAEYLDQREQMNAKVIHDVRGLVSELQESYDYVQEIIVQLESEAESIS